MSVGIGITTYNRPEAFEQCLSAVLEHAPTGAHIFVSDDGSDVDEYEQPFARAESEGVTVFRAEHANVATSKNRLLTAMMAEGVDHLFLVEDDMVPISPRAFRSYIKGSERWGTQHSMFAHHGTRNFQVDADHAFTYHYECVGSWVYYSAAAIAEVGLMDEAFDNAWEHVVHSMLLADAGFCGKGEWRRWPDVSHSYDLINEVEVASTNKARTETELMAQERVQAGLRHWRDTYRFPDDIAPLLKD